MQELFRKPLTDFAAALRGRKDFVGFCAHFADLLLGIKFALGAADNQPRRALRVGGNFFPPQTLLVEFGNRRHRALTKAALDFAFLRHAYISAGSAYP